MSSKTVTLEVNGSNVPLSFFVQTYFDRVLDGMAGALENTCPVETLDLKAGTDDIALTINDSPISMNEFVRNIVRRTAQGMIASLRGVEGIKTFTIRIGSGK
jgi:hypothetical protein